MGIQIKKYRKMKSNSFKNTTFLLAGGACLLMIAGRLFYSPDGLLPIKGFRFIASLAIPTLCLWVGMLIRWKVGKPKWWVLAIAGVAMLASLYLSRHTVNIFNWPEIRFYWYFLILVGFMMPWNYILEKGDKDGILSGDYRPHIRSNWAYLAEDGNICHAAKV